MSDQDYITIAKLEEENAALRKRVEELTEVVRGLSPHSFERDCIAAEVCPGVGESVLDAVRRKIRELMDSRKRVAERDKLQADLDAALLVCGSTSLDEPALEAAERVRELLAEREAKRG